MKRFKLVLALLLSLSSVAAYADGSTWTDVKMTNIAVYICGFCAERLCGCDVRRERYGYSELRVRLSEKPRHRPVNGGGGVRRLGAARGSVDRRDLKREGHRHLQRHSYR
jgi:hypothetical protein